MRDQYQMKLTNERLTSINLTVTGKGSLRDFGVDGIVLTGDSRDGLKQR